MICYSTRPTGRDSRAITERVKRVLSSIISPGQIGFMKRATNEKNDHGRLHWFPGDLPSFLCFKKNNSLIRRHGWIERFRDLSLQCCDQKKISN